MSEEVNPNPRGFVIDGVTFLDLGRIDAVFRDANLTMVHFAGRVEPVRFTLSMDNHRLLLKALEIYRSNR